MKRTLLSILVIGILLLSACATPSTAPEAETPPATPPATEPEPEPEEAPDYTPWIASQLRDLNQAMIQFTGKYPILTRVYDEEEKTYKRIDEVEGGEEVLIHEFTVGAGASWIWTFPMPAFAVSEAKTHIENAYWLTNKSKLPSEVRPRDVSTDEITQEVSEAITLLKLQVSYSYSWEEGSIEWITESTSPSPSLPPNRQPNKETTVRNLTELCDEYREELSRVIPKLELILSRLPSATNLEL